MLREIVGDIINLYPGLVIVFNGSNRYLSVEFVSADNADAVGAAITLAAAAGVADEPTDIYVRLRWTEWSGYTTYAPRRAKRNHKFMDEAIDRVNALLAAQTKKLLKRKIK